MASLNGFNANDVEPSKGFDPIPAGEYPAMIVDSEERKTKKGDGSYIALTVEIIEGEHKGRKFWENLNLENPNEQAVAIAKATLSAICRAVGVMVPKDTVELHHIPLTIKVGMEKNKDSGELQNRIKGWTARGAASPAATTSAKQPWRR